MKLKFANALSLALIMAMLLTSVGLADNLKDNATSAGLNVITAGGSTTIKYWIQSQGACEAADLSPSTVTIIVPAGVSVDTDLSTSGNQNTLTFTACNTSSEGNPNNTQNAVFSSLTSGSYSITHSVSDPSGAANPNPANFILTVNTAPNTAPSISVTGVSNGAIYNKGSVPVAMCDVTDAEDNPADFAAILSAITGPYASDGIGSQTADCSYIDAGGLTASALATYSIVDPSAPSVTYTLNPAAPDGNNGWYKGNVTLTWNVSESESPTSLQKTGCVDQNITADQAESFYSCSATSAGGSSETVTAAIKRDGTMPSITASRTPEANSFGWNNSSVTASYEASDGLSGLVSDVSGSHLFDQEGAGQLYIFTVSDFAGNSASATVENVNIDLTGPTLSLAFTPNSPDGNNGWWKTAGGVPYVWTCSDGLSDIDSTFGSGCPSPLSGTIAVQGTTNFSDQVQDLAGNLSAVVSRDLKLDNVAPVVAVTGVDDGATYILGSVPAAGCTTSDATSGVATNASLSSSGGPLGFVNVICSGASDNAGNAGNTATATYQVIYAWSGFFQPVDNDAVNTVKAGSAVPVKFSLGGNQGLNIFAVGYPKLVKTSCTSGLEDAIETTVTAGGSSLTYDALAGQYIYVWKTDKSWVGWCGQLQVKLIDGTLHTASFKFK